MAFDLTIDSVHATLRLDAVTPNMKKAMVEEFGDIADIIAADARARVIDHTRFLGKDPSKYLASIYGGVAEKSSGVTAFVRSGSPLAHLMEFGFTITDMVIEESAGEVMKFEGSAGAVYARSVHRHETEVQPYPAVYPAFEAARPAIEAALRRVVERAGGG